MQQLYNSLIFFLHMKRIKIEQLQEWFFDTIHLKYQQHLLPAAEFYRNFHLLLQELIVLYHQLKQDSLRQRDKAIAIANSSLLILNGLLKRPFQSIFTEEFLIEAQEKCSLMRCYCHSLSHIIIEDSKIYPAIQSLTGRFRNLVSEAKVLLDSTVPEIVKAMLTDVGINIIKNLKDSVSKLAKIDMRAVQLKYLSALNQYNLLRVDGYEQPSEYVKAYSSLKLQTLALQIQIDQLLELPCRVAAMLKENRKSKEYDKTVESLLSKFLSAIRKTQQLSRVVSKSKPGEFSKFLDVLESMRDDLERKSEEKQRQEEFPHNSTSNLQGMLGLLNSQMSMLQTLSSAAESELSESLKEVSRSYPMLERFEKEFEECLLSVKRGKSVEEQVRRLKTLVQTIILKEFKIKVKILIAPVSATSS